ncbi:hypothetical protein Y032_0640g1016 [Ancylostoma ceylanicum]|uniref:Uncharacterized protein n=1 Tax=Ancylostoma ceylanicum TaxID=53326 RepID=A0A016WKI7_9BILA|nr:hypothetical protein Y032_0640g1011 [Ancylostoma ceylanicum]EYC39807.1 hypothetical protein Y032_0640g1016 [Ancylostoma ceylanicum]
MNELAVGSRSVRRQTITRQESHLTTALTPVIHPITPTNHAKDTNNAKETALTQQIPDRTPPPPVTLDSASPSATNQSPPSRGSSNHSRRQHEHESHSNVMIYDSEEEYGEITKCYHVAASCDAIPSASGNTCDTPILMIVTARIYNERIQKYEPITFFLDCGSQTSFITNSAAKHLGLCIYDPKPFTTIAFGGHRSTEPSGSAKATFKDLLGNPLTIHLRTKNVITAPHKTPQLSEADRCHIESKGFDMPTVPAGKNVTADILIGIDYFWDIVSQEQSTCLPSGLVLTHTRFGPTVSGTPFFRHGSIQNKPPDRLQPEPMTPSLNYGISTSSESQMIPDQASTKKKTHEF